MEVLFIKVLGAFIVLGSAVLFGYLFLIPGVICSILGRWLGKLAKD